MEHRDALTALLSDRLRRARESRGWSQPELAERAGTHESSIAHYENGSRKPSSGALGRLADCLDVTADYLLGRSNGPELPEMRDPLFLQLAKIPAEDRQLGEAFLKILVNRHNALRSPS
ncbi:Transcriptional regulator, contains XRE-family HTH domain [Rhizobiales bacterium GAS191]|nr:Transcriptional regulator, contains XRE-family HTH domain [Rhizobiales bacterium GAS113]SEC38974.1 Transcriptional regulator, contains XRE-family HTH domain [Rhizobiales bacterium GAS188]SEC88460.1 Transcriptional regulator, contains XRE-family HTH domain [Rhizobiales bacterium GAS191]